MLLYFIVRCIRLTGLEFENRMLRDASKNLIGAAAAESREQQQTEQQLRAAAAAAAAADKVHKQHISPKNPFPACINSKSSSLSPVRSKSRQTLSFITSTDLNARSSISLSPSLPSTRLSARKNVTSLLSPYDPGEDGENEGFLTPLLSSTPVKKQAELLLALKLDFMSF